MGTRTLWANLQRQVADALTATAPDHPLCTVPPRLARKIVRAARQHLPRRRISLPTVLNFLLDRIPELWVVNMKLTDALLPGMLDIALQHALARKHATSLQDAAILITQALRQSGEWLVQPDGDRVWFTAKLSTRHATPATAPASEPPWP